VDGEIHLTSKQIKIDRERTEILNFNGIDVIRFTNEDVLNKLDYVLMEIKKEVKQRETSSL
tara:strand:+ start:586 stop:768 length:183 start_codon:yes stop_codon:yes gene_type:complete